MKRTNYPPSNPPQELDHTQLTSVELRALCNSFARRGKSDCQIALLLGLDVNLVRRAIADARHAPAE
jgi:hypothetical protein